jgi:folate-binding protein YgfZ
MPYSDSDQNRTGLKLIMTPLDYLTVARFTGPDAGGFLHAQLSADIAVLEPGGATFACCCSPRGQVMGLLLVCRQDDDYLVAAASELLPGILTRLKMFVLRSRVEFSAQPGEAICGVGKREELSGRDTFQPGGSDLRYHFPENAVEGNSGSENFKEQEIRNHVVWLGSETTEKFIPQMLGFDQLGAVSFTKGCYPGQEIVARARYLGKVKRKPVLVQITQELPIDPAERVELRREDTWSAGTVIDSVSGIETGTLYFIVAPGEPETAPEELRYQDRSYRCATT